MGLRVLLTGGGTGGHIFPAMAIAEALLQQAGVSEIAFVGRAEGFEARVVGTRGWPFFAIPAAPLKRIGWRRQLQGMGTLLRAAMASWRLLRRWRPTIVVGTGGYVSGPLLIMARLLRIPTVIHEQNSIPGLTNRWLGRSVRRVCITFAESMRYFPRRKVVDTGLPIRAALVHAAAERNTLPDPPTLLVIGGSQGAQRMNALMLEMLPHLRATLPRCRVIHQTGATADRQAVAEAYRRAHFDATVVPFIDEMEKVYPHASLAISRAGAGSLAELALFGVPAILVPYPYAADNHQEQNAREVVACGGALLLREQDATPERLGELCNGLLREPHRLQQMREAMRRQARPDAATRVATICIDMGQPHGASHTKGCAA